MKTIEGWNNAAGKNFHETMSETVKNYESWDKRATELEVFNVCEDAYNNQDSMIFEIRNHHTKSGKPETIHFYENEFVFKDRKED